MKNKTKYIWQNGKFLQRYHDVPQIDAFPKWALNMSEGNSV